MFADVHTQFFTTAILYCMFLRNETCLISDPVCRSVDFQALVGAAVANVGTASFRERLRSKYPPPEHLRELPDNDLLANRSQAVDHVTI